MEYIFRNTFLSSDMSKPFIGTTQATHVKAVIFLLIQSHGKTTNARRAKHILKAFYTNHYSLISTVMCPQHVEKSQAKYSKSTAVCFVPAHNESVLLNVATQFAATVFLKMHKIVCKLWYTVFVSLFWTK